MTAAGYWWCRLLCVVFGTLSIYWLFRVGRCSFGVHTGIAAAALLAMVPWHVRQSTVFKPDILMLLLVLVSCEAAQRVAASPTLRRHLAAGAAVGLAAAAKYNGAASALCLVAATLLAARGAPLRLARLAAAGAVTMATFALLNLPLLLQPWLLREDFGLTLTDYTNKATVAGESALTVPGRVIADLFSDRYHGWPVGLLAVVGLLAWGWFALRATGRRREELAILLSFPIGYVAIYVQLTAHPAEHNWLPVVPFTALAAASALALAGRGLVRRRRAAERLAPLASAALVVGSLAVAGGYVYTAAVPTTWARAEQHLLAALPGLLVDRLVVYEPGEEAWLRLRRQPSNQAAVVTTSDLGEDRRRIEQTADALLLRVAESRFAYVPPRHRGMLIEPSLLRSHGPTLRLVVHPWRCTVARSELTTSGSGLYAVPDPRPSGGWVSFRIVTAPEVEPSAVRGARFAGRPLRLFAGGRELGGHRLLSERVPVPDPPGPWRLRLFGPAVETIRLVERSVWEPPGGPGELDCP